jgi:tetratricopeptide (TPR) repeat protein
MGLIIAIIILGTAVAIVAFFLARSILLPKRVESLHTLLRQNKTQAVIKAARQLIAKDPRNADAHYLLGLAYDQENKRELALLELKAVNQIGNFDGLVDEVLFRQKIAGLYADFNQPEEALKEYLLLLKRRPSDAGCYYKIGRIFEDRNRSDKAAKYYKKACELDPRNAEARTRLGFLLYRAKRSVEAREELDAAVRLQPENYEAWYYIGRILKDSRDCIAAMSAFEKSSREPSLKVKSLVERGACMVTLGSLDRATSELERAVKLADDGSNESLHAMYILAHCYERMNRIEDAVVQWELIHSKKSGFRDVAEKLARFQDLRTNDRMKDYLTIGRDAFIEVCRQLTETLGLAVRDAHGIDNGGEVIAVENTSKWRNARSLPKLIRFLRVADIIDEPAVRQVHEEMRKQGITRGLIVTSSTFSRLAQDYAEGRPIDLYGKDRLESLLEQIEL